MIYCCVYMFVVCLHYLYDSTNIFYLYIRYYIVFVCSRSEPLSYCFKYAVMPCVSVSLRNLNLTNTLSG